MDRSVNRFSGYYVTADDGEINEMAKERGEARQRKKEKKGGEEGRGKRGINKLVRSMYKR